MRVTPSPRGAFRLVVAGAAALIGATVVTALTLGDLFPFGPGFDTVMSAGDDHFVAVPLPRALPFYDVNHFQVRAPVTSRRPAPPPVRLWRVADTAADSAQDSMRVRDRLPRRCGSTTMACCHSTGASHSG